MKNPFIPPLHTSKGVSKKDMLTLALEGRRTGFLAESSDGIFLKIPEFDNPLCHETKSHPRVASIKPNAKTLLHSTAPNPRSKHLENCVSLLEHADVILKAAQAGDQVATNTLLELVTKVLTRIPSKPSIESPKKEFYNHLRDYARRHSVFPFLVGRDPASLGNITSMMSQLQLGEKALVRVRPNETGRPSETSNRASYAGLAIALIEYFERIRTMRLHAPSNEKTLEDQLMRVKLTRDLFDRIQKLKPRAEANWESWHLLAVEFLKFRYGTLKAACGVGADPDRNANPSSSLKRSFRSIFIRPQRA